MNLSIKGTLNTLHPRDKVSTLPCFRSMAPHVFKHPNTKCHGTATVEIAICTQIVILLILAIADFSIFLYNKAIITDASRVLSRAISVGQVKSQEDLDLKLTETCSNNGKSFLISFDGKKLLPSSTFPDGPHKPKTPVTITVDFQYTPIILYLLPQKISSTTTMRME